MIKSYTSEDLFIIACISDARNDKEQLSHLSSKITDWDCLLRKSIKLRISPLLYHCIKAHKLAVPEAFENTLSKHYYKTLHTNTLLYAALTEVLSNFNTKNIKVLPLKGMYLAEKMYPSFELRQISDIDLLVSETDLPICVEILTSLGYIEKVNQIKTSFIEEHREKNHIPMQYKNGIGFELHFKAVFEGDEYQVPRSWFWENSSISVLSGQEILALKPHYLLMHILLHSYVHYIKGILHFVGYVDVVFILEYYKESFNWSEFIAICNKVNCTKQVFGQLAICVETFKCKVPLEIAELCKKEEDLGFNLTFKQFISEENLVQSKKINDNIVGLKHVKGIQNKFIFLLHDVFPKKEFMLHRYKPTHSSYWYLFYFVRIGDGLKSLFVYLFLRKKK